MADASALRHAMLHCRTWLTPDRVSIGVCPRQTGPTDKLNSIGIFLETSGLWREMARARCSDAVVRRNVSRSKFLIALLGGLACGPVLVIIIRPLPRHSAVRAPAARWPANAPSPCRVRDIYPHAPPRRAKRSIQIRSRGGAAAIQGLPRVHIKMYGVARAARAV